MSIFSFSSSVVFDISNTSLSGSICNHGNETFRGIEAADCGGDAPEVICPCGQGCCEDRTGLCVDQGLEPPEEDLCPDFIERIDRDGLSRCECFRASGSHHISCHYIDDCPTCNKDGTICGSMESFNYTFPTHEWSWRDFHGIFKYDQVAGGRSPPVTIETYGGSFDGKVAVNGQECSGVTPVRCSDGYRGYEINCSNVVLLNDENNETVDDPLTYDPCILDLNGGVLDVFGWLDWEVYSGCPFRAAWKN